MLLTAILYPLHLFLVDLATGIPLICLWLEWVGRKNKAVWNANLYLAHAAWVCLVGGAAIGTLQGILVWNEDWSRKLELAGSRIGFAGIEFLTSLVLLILYATLVQKRQRYTSLLWHWMRWIGLFVAGTNLLYHFPVLFGALGQMDISKFEGVSRLSAGEFRGLIFNAPVMAGWVHFTISSIAISSIVAWLTLNRFDETDARTLRTLAKISFVATASQWIAGPAVFINLSRTSQIGLTGSNTIWTAWFIQAMIFAMVLTVIQFQFMLRANRQRAWTVLGIQAFLVFAMSLVESNWN